jgi:hypothetical protein
LRNNRKKSIKNTLTNLLFSKTDGIGVVGREPIIPVGRKRKGRNDLRSFVTYQETDRLQRERYFYGH